MARRREPQPRVLGRDPQDRKDTTRQRACHAPPVRPLCPFTGGLNRPFYLRIVLARLSHGGKRGVGTGWNCLSSDRLAPSLSRLHNWDFVRGTLLDAYPCRLVGCSWVVGWSLHYYCNVRSCTRGACLGAFAGSWLRFASGDQSWPRPCALATCWIRTIIPIVRLLVSPRPGGVIATPPATCTIPFKQRNVQILATIVASKIAPDKH